MVSYEMYVGIDWATEGHDIAIVDVGGKLSKQIRVKHDGEALERFVEGLVAQAGGEPGRIGVAIEMTADAVIEVLLEQGIAVFGLNPKQLDRFRDGHTISGAKDDRRDAFVLADALRTDQHLFRPLELGDALLVELREVSRARETFAADVQRYANRMWQVVHRYFPQLLELGSLHEDKWLLDLFELAPSPASVEHLKRGKVDTLLKQMHVRRLDAEAVLTVLRKKPLPVAPGVAGDVPDHVEFVK
jgi:transposase